MALDNPIISTEPHRRDLQGLVVDLDDARRLSEEASRRIDEMREHPEIAVSVIREGAVTFQLKDDGAAAGQSVSSPFDLSSLPRAALSNSERHGPLGRFIIRDTDLHITISTYPHGMEVFVHRLIGKRVV